MIYSGVIIDEAYFYYLSYSVFCHDYVRNSFRSSIKRYDKYGYLYNDEATQVIDRKKLDVCYLCENENIRHESELFPLRHIGWA